MNYLLIALAIFVLSTGYFIYLFLTERKNNRNAYRLWSDERHSLNRRIIELKRAYDKKEDELSRIKRGWWPATPGNCNNLSRFARSDDGSVITNKIKYISHVGVVFYGSLGFLEWKELFVYVGKIN